VIGEYPYQEVPIQAAGWEVVKETEKTSGEIVEEFVAIVFVRKGEISRTKMNFQSWSISFHPSHT